MKHSLKGGGGVVDVTSGDVYCDVCGHKIGNYLEGDYFKLIATKYCPVHAGLMKAQTRRDATKAWRKRRKIERKEQKKTIDEFIVVTSNLIEYSKVLEDQIERLKREGRR